MKRRHLAALIASLLALPAAAVSVPPPTEPFAPEPIAPVAPLYLAAAGEARANAEAWSRDFTYDLERELELSLGALYAPRLASQKVVKGAPFSAEVVTENRQALADGNVISRKTTGRFYRDGEGRTRDETDSRDGKARSIVISDPAAQQRTVLVPDAKRAIVTKGIPTSHTSSKQVVKVDGTEVRVEDGRVSVNGKVVSDGRVELKAKSGRDVRVENGRVFIDGKEVNAGEGGGTRVIVRREDVDGVPTEVVNVQAVRIGEDRHAPLAPTPPAPPAPPVPGVAPVAPLPPLPPLPGLDVMRFESTARLGKGVNADLGKKDIDGVRAEGKSTTWTIPAGQIGNAKPINVVSETWYSPELQVTVYSRYSDPRTGEAIYRLAGIKRAEPAADLFRVPAGYEVRDRTKAHEEVMERAREARERGREARERAREERDRAREEQRHQQEEQRHQLEEQKRKAG